MLPSEKVMNLVHFFYSKTTLPFVVNWSMYYTVDYQNLN